MRSDFFVEFLNYDVALKTEERFRFFIDKFKQNIDLIKDYKAEKVREVDSLISVLDLLEKDLREFKRLLPSSSEPSENKGDEKIVKKVKKRVRKQKQKPVEKRSKERSEEKINHKSLDDLKLGLEKIKDELENM